MSPAAYCFHQDLEPEPPRDFTFDRHYLLYASSGALRLEAEGMRWSLAPARAALIAAHQTIRVALPQRVTACSVLFATDFVEAPAVPLTVFEMSPLGRELALECRQWGRDAGSLTPYARHIFTTLAQVVAHLASSPSPTTMPAPKSEALSRALDLTEDRLADAPTFESIAKDVGSSPRALARRFSDEMGMTWRAALRRLRMIRAIEALAGTSLSVTEISLAVGYSSLSAFNAAFRDFTGTTPTRYRRSFRR